MWEPDPMTLMPNGAEPMFGGAEVANFKALDSDVTLIVNREYCLSSRRSEMRLRPGSPFRRDSF